MKSQLQTEEGWQATIQAQDESVCFSADLSESMHRLAPPQEYPPSTDLFKQDSAAREIYFIESGLVKLTCLESDGEELILGLRSSRYTLGAASVILHKPYPLTAVTLTRCSLCRIPANVFLNVLETDSQFLLSFLKEQSREIYDQLEFIVQLRSRSARYRLAQLLLQQISALHIEGPQKEIRLQWLLKNREVAQLIAITPQHLSRLLRQMQLEGLIRREKNVVIVSDPQELCERVFK
jgi:CRP/FNR family transcriptional regulator